jgi:hypothetical protein
MHHLEVAADMLSGYLINVLLFVLAQVLLAQVLQ